MRTPTPLLASAVCLALFGCGGDSINQEDLLELSEIEVMERLGTPHRVEEYNRVCPVQYEESFWAAMEWKRTTVARELIYPEHNRVIGINVNGDVCRVRPYEVQTAGHDWDMVHNRQSRQTPAPKPRTETQAEPWQPID